MKKIDYIKNVIENRIRVLANVSDIQNAKPALLSSSISVAVQELQDLLRKLKSPKL